MLSPKPKPLHPLEHLPESLWQIDVLNYDGIYKQWCDIDVSETSDATANACNEKSQVRICLCKLYKLVNIRFDGFYTSLHRWYGIRLTYPSTQRTLMLLQQHPGHHPDAKEEHRLPHVASGTENTRRFGRAIRENIDASSHTPPLRVLSLLRVSYCEQN